MPLLVNKTQPSRVHPDPVVRPRLHKRLRNNVHDDEGNPTRLPETGYYAKVHRPMYGF